MKQMAHDGMMLSMLRQEIEHHESSQKVKDIQ